MLNSRYYRSIARILSDTYGGGTMVSAIVRRDDDGDTMTVLTLHYDGFGTYYMGDVRIWTEATPVYSPSDAIGHVSGGTAYEDEAVAFLAYAQEIKSLATDAY